MIAEGQGVFIENWRVSPLALGFEKESEGVGPDVYAVYWGVVYAFAPLVMGINR